MANHRADGRAHVRKRRLSGGTHCEAALPAGVVKVGVLGALATATIAAPLAAAAAGVEDAGTAVADTVTAEAPVEVEAAAVELPVASTPEAREDEDASRSEDREDAESTEDAEEAEEATATGVAAVEATELSVEVPEPEPEVTEAASTDEAAEEGTGTAEGTEESAPASSTGYIAPVNAPTTSGYGYRTHPVLGTSKMHDGVDFGATCGTPVKAAASGTVVAVEYHSASGNRVKIDHGNGVVTGYYHLQGFNTSVGATVAQGDTVGYVGSTGRSTGCHLHFSKMDEAGNYSDPMSLLR